MAAALPIIGLVGTLASTAVAVVGALNQGKGAATQAAASSQAADYRAQVADNNAAIARENQRVAQDNARAAEAAGAARADQESINARQLLGKQKVAAAASGLDVNSGSALDIRAGTAGQAMLTDLNIRDETSRRAYNYRKRGEGYGDQGSNFDIESEAARTAGAAAAKGAGAAETSGILSAAGAAAAGGAKTVSLLNEYKSTGVKLFGYEL